MLAEAWRTLGRPGGLLLAAMLSCAGVLLCAGEAATGGWRILGPGGGGALFHPTISPHDARTVLVASDMTGAYLTRDAGESWRMINLRGPVRFFVFDPVNPKVIYAQSVALWRSRDTGTTWELAYPAPEQVRGIRRNDDHAEDQIVTATGVAPPLRALAIDPADSQGLWALVEEGASVRLWASRDGGATWRTERTVHPLARRIYVDPQTSAHQRILYLVGDAQVEVFRDGRWDLRPAPQGVQFRQVSAGFASGGGGMVIYGITAREVWVSPDGGRSWRRSSLPGWSAELETVAAAERHGEVAYLSIGKLRAPLNWVYGVARTTNGGAGWQWVRKDDEQLAKNASDGWVTQWFGPGFGGHPLAIGVAPGNPEIAYTTDYARVLRTGDGGRTWRQVYTERVGGGWRSRGVDVTTSYGVHVDPFRRDRLFVSLSDLGLFRSDDNGVSWVSSSAGVPKPWQNTAYWVVIDPEVPGRMWLAASGTHDLPRPKMWRRASPSGFRGGVCRSDDGGVSWRASWEGAEETAATHILLDPRSPKEGRVLYVAGFGKGVFKSVNGGVSWTRQNQGLPETEPLVWRLAQDSGGALYAIVARRREDGALGGGLDGGLYRSRDGAASWQRVPLPDGVNGPSGLAIDPRDARRLYLACWGRPGENGAVGGGIYLSTDAGATWRPVLAQDQFVYDVTVDPRYPDILYAAGFSSSAWRSPDAGRSWRRITGFNFKWGHRVIADPHRPEQIYITTFGGGVWYGPAAGTPGAAEDIITPVVGYAPPVAPRRARQGNNRRNGSATPRGPGKGRP